MERRAARPRPCAMSVLPVPGGPASKTLRGGVAPALRAFCEASAAPATRSILLSSDTAAGAPTTSSQVVASGPLPPPYTVMKSSTPSSEKVTPSLPSFFLTDCDDAAKRVRAGPRREDAALEES